MIKEVREHSFPLHCSWVLPKCHLYQVWFLILTSDTPVNLENLCGFFGCFKCMSFKQTEAT